MRRRGVDTLYEMKLLAEDIIGELTQRYSERVREDVHIGILMGGLERISSGKAILYYIHGIGYCEATKFICSGHGGRYATSLAKFPLKEELPCEENAKRATFITAYVAEDVDVTVGGDPIIAIIHDTETTIQIPIKYLSENEVKNMVDKARNVKNKLDELLGFK